MNEISCEICMDLMPLVQDGVASDDSTRAVKEHIASCAQCRALYQEPPSAEVHNRNVMIKIKTELRAFLAFLTFSGMFFGISFLELQGVWYILFLMPVIGACSYPIYRWKALWKTPLVLSILYFLAHMISCLLGTSFYWLEVALSVSMIAFFADVGILIAGLLHVAFRKEK